ncbi:MAG: hypothetical protein U0167_08710 [bacterium]
MTSNFRTWLAGATLLAAASGVALLAVATRLAAGATVRPTPSDLPLGPAGRRVAGLAEDGRPALLIVLDPSCGACEQARRDLAAEPSLGLGSAGVAVAALPRARLEEAELRLPPGFYPAYLLFDGEGRPVAHRRGYGAPETVRGWASGALLDARRPAPSARAPVDYKRRSRRGP